MVPRLRYTPFMATSSPSPRPEIPALRAVAIEDLRYIRETMERSAAFTAVPGWGMVLVGVTALGAAFWASRQPTLAAWVSVWFLEAAIAIGLGVAGVVAKAKRAGGDVWTAPAQRFTLSFCIPLFAGMALTLAFLRAGEGGWMPGTWLLLYGAAMIAGGAFSVRVVPLMGASFAALGVVTLFLPHRWGDAMLASGFGVLHLVFGSIIARRHGG